MTAKSSSVAVLGAGSWGTALALLLSNNGHSVKLWDRDRNHIERLSNHRCNQQYLPGIPFPENLTLHEAFDSSLTSSDYILVAVPSIGFRDILKKIAATIGSDFKLIWATKGLETDSGKFLHDVVTEELPALRCSAIVSGPSFAAEVAAGLPTAVTVASYDHEFSSSVADLFHSPVFRTYTSNDVIGVELGGSIKNVLAIAAGISDGLGYGANARAALITRGLAEMMRIGEKLGGRRETFMGLTGVGDLVLTCTDDQSRNRRLGLALGKGLSCEGAVADIGQAVEGLHAAKEIYELAHRLQVELPIVEHVKRVLFDGMPPSVAVQALLAREQKAESL